MLTPQQRLIVNYLEDMEWHCMASAEFFMKDDRKRISELNQRGYEIEGTKCDGRCGVKHSARVFMRRIVRVPPLNPYQLFHKQMQSK